MKLITDRYYKFTEPDYKFWYKQFNNSDSQLGKAGYQSFDVTDKHPLKFVEQFERWGTEELWFDYYDDSTGNTYTGEVGCFLIVRRDEGLSEYFGILTATDFLPESVVSDLDEVWEAIDNKESKEFSKAMNAYQMGRKDRISLHLGINDELEEDEQEVDVPEFTFEVSLEKDEFRLSVYLQDANWGDPFNFEIIYAIESPNIGSLEWDKERALLVDRIKLYKTQLSFVVDAQSA